jgi:hypothetical protein
MNRVYLLVEGPSDAAFLRRILPEALLKTAEVVAAGGSSEIPSLARSLLARRNNPVAVLMDADSLAPDAIQERHQSTEELIRAANASIPVKVVFAVPEIEAWFFAAPKLIERMVGQEVPAPWIDLGKRDPKGILKYLSECNQRTWDLHRAISSLDEEDIEQIRAVPAVAELCQFIQDMQKGEQAA